MSDAQRFVDAVREIEPWAADYLTSAASDPSRNGGNYEPAIRYLCECVVKRIAARLGREASVRRAMARSTDGDPRWLAAQASTLDEAHDIAGRVAFESYGRKV